MADDPKVSRNTPGTETPEKKEYVYKGNGSNVLNKYRSFTYNFTFSALKKDDVNKPESYRNSELDLVILRSGGKGAAGITSNVAPVEREYKEKSTDSPDTSQKKTQTVTNSSPKTYQDYSGSALVQGFNKNSPGRFDMFIDNVEIETLMGFSEEGGTSQPTTFKFEVFEPYSINGFVEALHVSAVASGYPTYTGASFLLKMEFVGYPDSAEFSTPEVIDKATRYFPIRLTNLEVTVDERGTRYVVSAIAFNEAGYGSPSQIKKPIKMTGKTVKDILENLMDGLTKQAKEFEQSGKKKTAGANGYDEYKIKFPSWSSSGWADSPINKIGQAEVAELLKDNTLYKFPDPGSNTKPTANKPAGQTNPTPEQNAKAPETYKLEPGTPVVQFAEGKNVHECIAGIIRDSKYVRGLVEKLSSESEANTVKDQDGMVDYFLVKMEVTNKEVIDPDSKRPYQIFTYVVTPHKILFTRIPGYGTQQVDIQALAKLSLRQYNYIYTGENVDVLNFKLNFNTLFFEALPAALGNDASPPPRDAAARGNNASPKLNPDNVKTSEDRKLPAAPAKYVPTDVGKDNASQRQSDAYYALAKNMHEAIVNSKGSMLTGDVEILGDPLYLVTGGIGNYNPKPSKDTNRITDEGEAAFNFGEVLITINFKNPIDILPLEQGGMHFFDKELIPFSGIYRVNKVRSHFKEGVFKQTLEVIRAAGQPAPTENPTASESNKGTGAPSKVSDRVAQESNKNDVVSADTSPATEVVNTDTQTGGNRAGTFNLLNQLGRGLPSPGLPGELSNFTAATGGLGGTVSVTQVSGATPNLAGNTRIATQIFGGIVPGGVGQSAGGIPLPAKAAVGLQQQVLRPAALLTQVGMSVAQSLGIKGPAAELMNQVLKQESNKVVNKVLGSGIGKYATIAYSPSRTTSPDTYAGYRNQQNATAPTSIPTTGIAEGLNTTNLAAVGNVGGGAGIYGDVNSNINSAMQGTPTDPSAIASQYGVNASQLSGLSPNLGSKVIGQLTGINNAVPANTNLSTAAAQGINLNGLTPAGVASLPPTAPYSVAPNPAPDTGFLNSITASGGTTALARAFGVNRISEVSQDQLPTETTNAAQENIPTVMQNKQTTALAPNIMDTVAGGLKYLTANSQLAGLTGLAGTKEGQLLALQNRYPGSPINVVADLGSSTASKFGSKSSGTSPLDKIMIR